jgi:thiamine-monophosphate kinase
MTKNISEENILFGYIKDILHDSTDPRVPVTAVDMDDCALIRINDTQSMAVTSDFVRGSGFTLFKLGQMNYFDVGYYLISANLSDLAAVGALPVGLTTIIRHSDQMNDQDFKDVLYGMKESADVHQARIIGGDTGSYNADVFAATAFGFVDTDKALLRKNVKQGDLLCVTGVVGRPMTTQIYFKEAKPAGFELTTQEENEILSAWKRPQARVNEGLLLSGKSLANSCMDVSDGLKASIDQLSNVSGKYFTLYEDKVPLHPATIKLAKHFGIHPVQIAVSASVDFELLFTIPPENQKLCEQAFADKGFKMNVIGETNNTGKNLYVDSAGHIGDMIGVSWNQQKGDFYKDIVKK